ncbi:MAG: efflux RND transporter permease subunit [Betaproteobacteria bacterium]|nr:efflux RND transporter permease subunit [Betaproteobacteria bacterium]
MWITRVSINNPVFATMVMIAILVLGVASYNRLAVEQMPDIDFPVAVVFVSYPGASPEAVETDLTKPIEDAVNPIGGVRQITSRSREGSCVVIIEFELKTDVNVAIQEVRDRIARIRIGFPRDAKEPYISKADTDNEQPIFNLAVTSEQRGLRELTTMAEQVIRKRLENVRGVGSIELSGGTKRQIQILLDPAAMTALGVGVEQVIAALRNENLDMPAGSITRGSEEKLVRVEGRIKDPVAFSRIIVARRGNAGASSAVTLGQVARVIDGEADVQSAARNAGAQGMDPNAKAIDVTQEDNTISRLDGRRAITLEVVKIRGANTVEVGNGLRDAVAELTKQIPADIKLTVMSDRSEWVKRSVDDTQKTILEGALVTVLVVFLFLHSWRSTVITALTLPISVIATFIALHALGFTINALTLMALSLCIGLLIDDAIVVRENIVRHLGMGKDHFTAANEGTTEVGLAVMATTFTIVAVFLPVAFMGGIIGLFFYQFGVTVAVAVLVSLFVSFTLDPMLSSIWHDPVESRFRGVPWLGAVLRRFEGGVEGAHRLYGRWLGWSLNNRKTVLGIAVGALLGAFGIVMAGAVGSEFMPETDNSELTIRLSTPVGSSLAYTESKVDQAEQALREFPEVKQIYSRIGTTNGRNSSFLNAKLVPRAERRFTQKQLEQKFRERLRRIAGIELSVGWMRPIQVSIVGPDAQRLKEIGAEVERALAGIKGVTEIESSEKAASPTLAIRINRQLASDLGLTLSQIANATRPLIAGDAVTTWLGPDGQNYDVLVRLPEGRRQSIADFEQLYLQSSLVNPDGTPRMIPLRQIAEFVDTTSPKIITRMDLQRQLTLSASVEGRPQGDVGQEVSTMTREMQLPAGYRFNVGGQTKQMIESFKFALVALGIAVIFIYLILASQFGSFLQPLAIMASLPLSLVGVFIALAVTRSTLNIFSVIGIIMLMGLVTKNAILLIDFTNQARKRGLDRVAALQEAAQVRLRPILMTTAAMIFGMMPLALGLGEGSEGNATMGRAIIGGVISSTLLTLVVVPVVYTYLDGMSAWFRSRRARRADSAALPAAAD